jgi:hypothetical protein
MKVSQLIAALHAEDPEAFVVVPSLTGVGFDCAGQIYRVFLADADPERSRLTRGQFTLVRQPATPVARRNVLLQGGVARHGGVYT